MKNEIVGDNVMNEYDGISTEEHDHDWCSGGISTLEEDWGLYL